MPELVRERESRIAVLLSCPLCGRWRRDLDMVYRCFRNRHGAWFMVRTCAKCEGVLHG